MTRSEGCRPTGCPLQAALSIQSPLCNPGHLPLSPGPHLQGARCLLVCVPACTVINSLLKAPRFPLPESAAFHRNPESAPHRCHLASPPAPSPALSLPPPLPPALCSCLYQALPYCLSATSLQDLKINADLLAVLPDSFCSMPRWPPAPLETAGRVEVPQAKKDHQRL